MSVRGRHLVAYAASMFSLFLLQMFTALPFIQELSDYHLDIYWSVLSQLLCMGIIPLTVLLILRRDVSSVSETFRYMRYRKPTNKKATLLATLGIAILVVPYTMAFNALSNLFLRIIGYKRTISVGTIYNGVGDLILYLFLIAVLPAIFEEFTHRGVLLSGLEDRGSEMSAVIWSAVLFGLMHENPNQMLFTTFGGILFALAAVKTGSILPAVIAHFANNAIATLLDYSTQRKTSFGVWYDSITSSNNALSVLLLVAVMVAAVYGIVRILQYLSRKAEKPVSERKLFGVITVDGYSPNGKAMLADNICLLAVTIAQGTILALCLIWGIAR